MPRQERAGLAVAAGLLAGGALVFAAGTAGGGEAPLSPEKDAVAAGRALTDEELRVQGPGFAQPGGDLGGPVEIAAVRRSITRLLDLHRNSMRMPAAVDERRAGLESIQARVRRTMPRVWDERVAPRQGVEVIRDIGSVLDDPGYRAYSDSRFRVTRWQGVHVQGDRATAVLTGYSEYLVPGDGWNAELEAQYQFTLSRTSGRRGDGEWRLIDKIELILEGQG